MKMNQSPLLVLSLAAALTGCGDRAKTQVAAEVEPAVQAPTAPVDAAPTGNRLPPVTVPAGAVVDLPTGEGENVPLALNVGQSAVGTATATRAGEILAVDVQVGNFVDTSDGALILKLCSDGLCRTGSGNLLSSVDNSMFTIVFDEPLTVSETGRLTYEFTKQEGAVPIVIWTYPVVTRGENEIQYKDGDALGRSARIALHYAK